MGGFMNTKQVNRFLELERKNRRLTMEEFTKDIISERTYRRYLYEDTEIPYQVFEKLLTRLNINPFGFIYGSQAFLVQENPHELDLVMSLMYEDYEEVDKILKTQNGKPFESFFGEYLIPLFMIRYEVHKRGLSKLDAQKQVLNWIELDNLLLSSNTTLEPIVALSKLYEWIPSSYDERLLSWLLTFLSDPTKIHFSIDRMGYGMLYNLIFKLKARTMGDISEIESAFKETIDLIYFRGCDTYLYDLYLSLIELDLYKQSTYFKRVLELGMLPSLLILPNSSNLIKRIPKDLYESCLMSFASSESVKGVSL
jgi:hypothetical protein